jgi:hypothetical protein
LDTPGVGRACTQQGIEALGGRHPAVLALYAGMVVLSAIATPRGIEKVVCTELVFLLAAARINVTIA